MERGKTRPVGMMVPLKGKAGGQAGALANELSKQPGEAGEALTADPFIGAINQSMRLRSCVS